MQSVPFSKWKKSNKVVEMWRKSKKVENVPFSKWKKSKIVVNVPLSKWNWNTRTCSFASIERMGKLICVVQASSERGLGIRIGEG